MSQASPVDSQVLGHTVGWAQDAKNVFCLQKRHQPLLAHPGSEVADCGQGHLQATTLQPADRKGGEAWRSLLSKCSSTRKEFGAHIGPLRVPTLTLGRAPHRNVPGGLGLFTSLDTCHWEGKRGLKCPLYPLLQAPPPITTHRGSLLPLLLSGPRSQLLRRPPLVPAPARWLRSPSGRSPNWSLPAESGRSVFLFFLQLAPGEQREVPLCSGSGNSLCQGPHEVRLQSRQRQAPRSVKLVEPSLCLRLPEHRVPRFE